jgi:hypothetical protein
MCLDQLLDQGNATGQGMIEYDDALEEDDEVRANGDEDGDLDIDEDQEGEEES